MKINEITKKEFVQGLKDPRKQVIKTKIKEIRKEIRPLGWMIQSSYNSKNRTLSFNIFPVGHSLTYYDLKTDSTVLSNLGEVKQIVVRKFPKGRNDYTLFMGWQSSNNDFLTAEVVIN